MQASHTCPATILLVVLLLAQLCVSPTSSTDIIGTVTGTAGYVLPTVVDLYLLQGDGNTSITIQSGSNSANINALLAGNVDFAIISGALSPAQAAAHPNLTVLPVMGTAMVPIYRLDALNSSIPLTFSGATLALIYAGNITNWSDPLIQADNVGVVLPNQTISIGYQLDVRQTTTAFLEYLVQSEPSIASMLPPSSKPTWPISRYASSSGGVGTAGVAAYVANMDGSVGFSVQQAALQSDVNVAQLVNQAGNVVSATQAAITYTLTEQLQAPKLTAFTDLTNCASAWCWPIVTA